MESTPGAAALKPRLKVSAKAKSFVLDTNVLLHDPNSIYKFEDNNLAIPVEVLEELDAIKTEQSTERGRNARRVHRILSELLPDSRSMHEGVKLPNGGTLSSPAPPRRRGWTPRERLRVRRGDGSPAQAGMDPGASRATTG